jgi:hypothetical protein
MKVLIAAIEFYRYLDLHIHWKLLVLSRAYRLLGVYKPLVLFVTPYNIIMVTKADT